MSYNISLFKSVQYLSRYCICIRMLNVYLLNSFIKYVESSQIVTLVKHPAFSI